MNDYLKNISSIDDSSTGVSFSQSPEESKVIVELPEQPPTMTYSIVTGQEAQLYQDNAQYLTPQRVKLRKYTLKKG